MLTRRWGIAAGRPGLRVAGDRVADGNAERRAAEPGEALGQPVEVEVAGGLDEAHEQPLRLRVLAVASEALGDQAVVVRPDRPEVVADGVVGDGVR